MGGALAIDATLEHPDRVWALVPVAAGLGGFEPLQEEEDWWEDAGQPIEAAIEAGDLERAEDLRLKIWAPLGTDDPAGREDPRDRVRQHPRADDGRERARSSIDPPAAARLHEIDVPTLVVTPSTIRRSCAAIGRPDRARGSSSAPRDDRGRRPRGEPAAAGGFDAAVLPFLDDARP